jgi:hypothetical protein
MRKPAGNALEAVCHRFQPAGTGTQRLSLNKLSQYFTYI